MKIALYLSTNLLNTKKRTKVKELTQSLQRSSIKKKASIVILSTHTLVAKLFVCFLALTMLHFMMRVTLIERLEEGRSQAIRELVHECVVNCDKRLFPNRIHNSLVELYNQQNHKFTIDDISEAYAHLYVTLNKLYLDEYRATNSFNFLKRNLEKYEEVYKRLNTFKML